jgi:WD40 repeat protein
MMKTHEKPVQKIVHAPAQSLAVRSAALVSRGLRDLARDSNWLVKKVFAGRASHLAISGTGQVCGITSETSKGAAHLVLYDIESTAPELALAVPKQSHACPADSPARFAWSPTSRYMAAAWEGWQLTIHLFDMHGKAFLGEFGEYKNFPKFLVWSETGKYFGVTAPAGKKVALWLWKAARHGMPISGASMSRVGAPHGIEPQSFGEGFAEEGAFLGYGRCAFSPDETSLATVAEIQGEWADDLIVIFDVPTLRKRDLLQVQGHITDLTWAPDNQQIIYCAAGQAYRLPLARMEFETLPFGAELCACHPHLPLCVCFSAWLKNSAKGRLFLVDLNDLAILDEYPAEGVVDLRWNLDGSKAYAITQDGLAYIYDPPLI